MNALVIAMLLGATAQVTGQMSPTSDVSSNRVKATGTTSARALKDIAADVFGSPGASYYVNTNATFASDSNPCVSWAFPCRTILGAHDKLNSTTGGTIYYTDSSIVGGEVAHQGLWFMGANDPQWNGGSVPLGWRKAKPLTLVGVGSYAPQYSRAPVARILGGQDGTWTRDVSKPGLWISGSSAPMVFNNIGLTSSSADLYRAVLLAVPSNRSATDSQVSNVTFNFSYFNVQAVGEIPTDVGRGPAVEAEHTFWAYFNDCVFLTNGNYSPAGPDSTGLTGAQRGASITVVPRSSSSGAIVVRRTISSMGGLNYTVGSTTWGFVVDDWTLESDFVTSVAPVVAVDNTANVRGRGRVYDVSNSDAPGSDAAVAVIPASAPPSDVVAVSIQSSRGPVKYLDGDQLSSDTFSRTRTYTQDKAIGYVNGRLTARTNAGHRLGAPSAARFANLLTAAPTTGSGWTITAGEPDPFGGTGAFRAATTAESPLSTLIMPPGLITTTLSVGDAVVGCGWVRTPVGVTPVPGTPNVKVGAVATNDLLDRSASNVDVTQVDFRDTDEWVYFSVGGIFTSIGTASTQITMVIDSATIAATGEGTFDMYMPTLHYIPVGTLPAAELHEFLNHGCNPLPYGAKAKIVYVPAGFDVELADTTRGVILRDGSGGRHRLLVDPTGAVTTQSVP